jgi:hypothetical protein
METREPVVNIACTTGKPVSVLLKCAALVMPGTLGMMTRCAWGDDTVCGDNSMSRPAGFNCTIHIH